VVNTLLTELDGLSTRDGIYLIAAKNRPDIIDPAMLRPGRLEERIFVGLPGPEERVAILQTLIRQKKALIDPSLASVAEQDCCQNFSGADLGSLLYKAAQLTLRRDAEMVEACDFEGAIELVKPSVENVQKYERMRKTFGVS
jgi:ribosome biogenesis ATPase